MNYNLFIIIGFILSSICLKAQDVKVGLQTGYGFYKMSSLTVITEKAVKELPFKAKIISNYPAYHYYQPMVKLSKTNFDFGFLYTYQTTGSRISYKDYSGEYRLDSKINCNSPGIVLIFREGGDNKIKKGFSLKAGMNFSTLKFIEYLRVETTSTKTELKFKSQSFFLEPGLNLTYPINRLCFEFSVEYYMEILRDNYSQIGSGEGLIPVKKKFGDADIWDGIRVGITFTYTLFKTKVNTNPTDL